MRKIKKIGIFMLSILLGLSSTNAVTLWTLRGPIGGDVSEQTTTIQGQRSIFNMISLVNNYLWFAIGFVCFVFMVRNGYQLIIARGDEKQMKSATNSLIGCAVGLAVCILAHIVVNIAVKLFAD